tara:strand:+ start:4088 stop:9868 length:5781 start_codon:yes stop_codon:yes gene_type:complete
MAKHQRNFAAGIMNKSVDERLLPNGEYADAMNVRLGSTEDSEIGSVENAKGNVQLTNVAFPIAGFACSAELSPNAVCLGSYADPANETIYWFVHDPTWMGIYPTDSGGATAPGSVLVTSSTTGGPEVLKLIDTTQSFTTSVSVGDIVKCGTCTNADYVYVTEVVSNSTLILSGDLTVGGIGAGVAYTITQNLQRCDMVVSFNTVSGTTDPIIVSMWDGVVCDTQWTTTLNFNPRRLITGVNLIDDMLFWTDNYNPPRKINVTKSYPYPAVGTPTPPSTTCSLGVDDPSLAKDILVIKAPPLFPPGLSFNMQSSVTAEEQNYLENRMLCFAYRYKYSDKEYSALSPFTQPAFGADMFFLSPDSLLNEGMTNRFNSVSISYDSGPEAVIGVDIVFKEADSNVIKIVEKIDKDNANGGGALQNNQTYTVFFDNSKIYTVLPSDEILRLYDNVPRIAKAQTLMGNRLMYGNYVDGYDMINMMGWPVQQEWVASLDKESPDVFKIPITYQNTNMATYKFGSNAPCQQGGSGGAGTSYAVNAYRMTLNFAGIPLQAGSILRLRFRYNCQNNWQTGGQCWYDTTGTIGAGGLTDIALNGGWIDFNFTIDKNYSNALAMFNDPDQAFKKALGYGDPLTGNIKKPITGTSGCATGSTLTDRLNCMTAPVLVADYSQATYQYLFRAIAADSLPCPTTVNEVTSNDSKGLVEYIQWTGTQQMSMKVIPVIYNQDQNLGGAFDPCAVVWPSFEDATAVIDRPGSGKSLHSNRGYELGIIYLDEFGRSTTAFTSKRNSVSTLCSDSSVVSKAKVVIPPTQLAPKWATHYRFVIKPDEENYETIYSSKVFLSSVDGSYWFLLDGQNATKVEVGDRLLCKKDISGPVSNCDYAEVLFKGSKPKNFIKSINPTYSGNNQTDDVEKPGVGDNPKWLAIPQGVYMQLKNISFSIPEAAAGSGNPELKYPAIPPIGGNNPPFPIRPITQMARSTTTSGYTSCPTLYYRGIYGAPTWDNANSEYTFSDLEIPAETVVRVKFRFERKGPLSVAGATTYQDDRRIYTYDQTFEADTDYDNIIDFWNAQNIGNNLSQGALVGSLCADGFTVEYVNSTYFAAGSTTTGLATAAFGGSTCLPCKASVRWARMNNNEVILVVRGPDGGGSYQTTSLVSATIDISFTQKTIVFESEPQDALPNVWYEDTNTYTIDQATGGHNSGIVTGDQNQVPGIPGDVGVQSAIIHLGFYNCYSFGNGVESYKVRDSLTGKSFKLGNRVTSTSADYGMKRRFADMTYSGVYNDESNVNRLNEFNLGLLNFKTLEDSFGHIQILSGRETDVLVLQEDKISYVLAGKNLLSDSEGGGDIASIPQVLGTQIARTEDYGISKNPESYCEYGYDKYFTDQKRGAILRLRGSSSKSEQLDVISEYGMRSWVRDVFNGSGEVNATASDPSTIGVHTQKIGGWDPYMNEYVVSINDNPINILSLDPCDELSVGDFVQESDFDVSPCGEQLSFTAPDTTPIIQTIILSFNQGLVTWEFNATGADFDISVQWNNAVAASGTVNAGGTLTLTFTKDLSGGSLDVAIVTITPTGAGTLGWEVGCPLIQYLSTIPVIFRSLGGDPLSSTTSTTLGDISIFRTFQWSKDLPSGDTISGQLYDDYITVNNTNLDESILTDGVFPLCMEWDNSGYLNQIQNTVGPPNGSTMTLKLTNWGACAANDFACNAFDPAKCRFLWIRSATPYAKDITGARALRNDAITAGNIMTLESWDSSTSAWIPAVAGADQYRGSFTVPTPVAPATDPYLYIIYDLTLPTQDPLCHNTLPQFGGGGLEDVCCVCACPVGTVNTCYQITAVFQGGTYWIDPNGDGTISSDNWYPAPSQWTFEYTDTLGVVQTMEILAPAEDAEPTIIYVCSQSVPVFINTDLLPTQPDGSYWPFPTVTIQGCYPGACTCP